MTVLDVRGLPREKVEELQRMIDQWRQKNSEPELPENGQDKEVIFTTQKSRVIGLLTRREIYEYL